MDEWSDGSGDTATTFNRRRATAEEEEEKTQKMIRTFEVGLWAEQRNLWCVDKL